MKNAGSILCVYTHITLTSKQILPLPHPPTTDFEKGVLLQSVPTGPPGRIYADSTLGRLLPFTTRGKSGRGRGCSRVSWGSLWLTLFQLNSLKSCHCQRSFHPQWSAVKVIRAAVAGKVTSILKLSFIVHCNCLFLAWAPSTSLLPVTSLCGLSTPIDCINVTNSQGHACLSTFAFIYFIFCLNKILPSFSPFPELCLLNYYSFKTHINALSQ